MSTQLKISANTSEVKKSLLELNNELKNLGKVKTSIFSEDDKKFLRETLKQELSAMKDRLSKNRDEIAKLVNEQSKLTKGSQEELKIRKEIIDAYKIQNQLSREMATVSKMEKQAEAGGGFMGGLPKIPGAGKITGFLRHPALLAAAGAFAIGNEINASGEQFQRGASSRVRLSGLGMASQGFASPRELAEAGLTEQEFMQRQIRAASSLGRRGGSTESILQQSRFERAQGLESGALLNVSTALRASMGGEAANTAQLKLQASILGAGIEDALQPYLDSVTGLLADINENGLTNTDELLRAMATLTKESGRTPEQIASLFGGLNAAMKGSSGEANAFFQSAFARSGIGGGTIGATRLAISSGGLFGLSQNELAKRQYTPEQIQSLQQMGIAGTGMQPRGTSILEELRTRVGIPEGQKLGDVTGESLVALNNLANAIMGTQGLGGIETIKLLEQSMQGQLSQDEFDKKVKELIDKQDPTQAKLAEVNSTLAGQLEVQTAIRDNLREALGVEVGADVQRLKTQAMAIPTRATLGGVEAIRAGARQFDLNRPSAGESVRDAGFGQLPPAILEKLNAGKTTQAPPVQTAPPIVKNNTSVTVKVQTPDGAIKDSIYKH